MTESLVGRSFKIFSVVCAYWCVSISLVFLNKFLLAGDFKLEAPLFITWYQCVVSLVVLFFLSLLGDKYPAIDKFPAFQINPEVCKQILPLSIFFVGMITANNLCLKFLDVAFYNVARALTTFFNVVFSYFILGQSTSLRAIGCCGFIILGFSLGIREEGNISANLNYWGIFFGVLGSLFVCLNAIFTKRCMPAVDGNIWRLQMYNNFNAVFLFIPLMLYNGDLTVLYSFTHLYNHKFWMMMSLSGVFGIAIGYVTGLQIKVTSPLTHNISGTAKACAQTVLAVVYFATYKSTLWWGCNMLVLGGSALYTYTKAQDMKKAADSGSGSQNKV